MPAFPLSFISGEALDLATAKRSIQIKKLLAGRPESLRKYEELLKQVEDLIFNDVRVRDWNPALCGNYALLACSLVRGELAVADKAEAPAAAHAAPLALAEWLCSFTGGNEHIDPKVRSTAAGLWARARLAVGGPLEALGDMATALVDSLRPLNVSEDDLSAQVRAELVVAAARPGAAETAPSGSLETARQWCRELASRPALAAYLGPAAKSLEALAARVAPPPAPLPPPAPVEPPPPLSAAGSSVPATGGPKKPLGPSSSSPTARLGWAHLFRTERELIERFPEYADNHLGVLGKLGLSLPEAEKLALAKKQHEAFTARPANRNTNMFLAPAVEAAVGIARALDQNRHWREAFLVANDFAEMAKVLVRRNKELFQPILDDLLLIACCSCSGLFAEERAREKQADREGELVALKRRLDELCGRAVATFYDDRAGRFIPNKSPDTGLAEWATNEALARHFDARLRHLLQYDRPGVKDFAELNLILAWGLKNLAPVWAGKRAEWREGLVKVGYKDLVDTLIQMGLKNPDDVGKVGPSGARTSSGHMQPTISTTSRICWPKAPWS